VRGQPRNNTDEVERSELADEVDDALELGTVHKDTHDEGVRRRELFQTKAIKTWKNATVRQNNSEHRPSSGNQSPKMSPTKETPKTELIASCRANANHRHSGVAINIWSEDGYSRDLVCKRRNL